MLMKLTPDRVKPEIDLTAFGFEQILTNKLVIVIVEKLYRFV